MQYVLIWVIGIAVALLVSFAIIRAAVRSALMDHYLAVQHLDRLGEPAVESGPRAPLKWWQR